MLTINTELIPFLEEMMYEFIDQRLEVVKIRSQTHEGSFNRAVSGINPEWYQRMCADFPRPIQPSQPREKRIKKRTIVKRKDTIKLFNRLIKFCKSKSKYAPYLVDEAQRRLDLCQEVEGLEPWDNQF